MNEKNVEVLIEENRKLKELLIKAVGDLEGLSNSLREEGNNSPCLVCKHYDLHSKCFLQNTKSKCFSWKSIEEYYELTEDDLPF